MQEEKSDFSEKDLQLIKQTYRTVLEDYYDNPTNALAQQIVLLNSLACQVIRTHAQSSTLLLVSMLEVLKLKVKSHHSDIAKQLAQSVNDTIIQMKNPAKIPLTSATLLGCLEEYQLNRICCVIMCRVYHREMRGKDFEWRAIIAAVCKFGDKHPDVSVEVLSILLKDHHSNIKEVSKGGFVKYLFSIYLSSCLDSKNNLYKALKLLKIVSESDRTILNHRQKYLTNVIYTHNMYIPICREITEFCFDTDYCMRVVEESTSEDSVDALLVWTFNICVAEFTNQDTIDHMEKLRKEKGQKISPELQWKVYTILANIVKVKTDIKLKESILSSLPIHPESNLESYLNFLTQYYEKHPDDLSSLDLKTLQYLLNKSKNSTPYSAKLLQKLKFLSSADSGVKVHPLRSSLIDTFSHDNNPEIMLQKAAKVPKSSSELDSFSQLLNQKPQGQSEYQQDTLHTIKLKAIQTLRSSVANNSSLQFSQIINNYEPNNLDELNKLLKVLELYFTIDPNRVKQIKDYKLVELIEWIQNNHGIEIVDWVAISQVLELLFDDDQWGYHLQEVPKRCFWLLNASDGKHTEHLIQKLKEIKSNNPKAALIVGFLGKSNDIILKKRLLSQTRFAFQLVEQIERYNKTTNSNPYSSNYQEQIQLDSYLINVLNLSHFIFDWEKSEDIKHIIENKIIKPVLNCMSDVFQGKQHEVKFLQNCLPHKINFKKFKDLNLERIIETNGKLAAELYDQHHDKKSLLGPLQNINSESNPSKIEQIFRFLDENPDAIDSEDFLIFVNQLLNINPNDRKYWNLYPYYMGILLHVLSVASKSSNKEIINQLNDILEKIISNSYENEDIAKEELEELYQQLYKAIERLGERGVPINAKKLKREVEKIQNSSIRDKIIQKLQVLSSSQGEKKIVLQVQKSEIKEEIMPQKYNKKYQVDERDYASQIKATQSNFKGSDIEQHPGKVNKLEGQVVNTDIVYDIDEKKNSQEQITILNALKILKKIIDGKEPKNYFGRVVDVLMENNLDKKQKYLFGHLLTEYYNKIERDPLVIKLLKLSDKTNLNKNCCYEFLKKFEQVFEISKRWKLTGQNFVTLSIERVQTRSQNKHMCVENGCEIIEYNLVKTSDIDWFGSKGYHQIMMKLAKDIEVPEQAIYYLLLIGTSSRLIDIKTYYVGNNLHSIILQMINKQGWINEPKLIANLSYALSSLSYTQNQIAIEVVSRRSEMLDLFSAYRRFCRVRVVVESGCSMISNLCYSNPETKNILFNYEVIQLLSFLFKVSLDCPQLSTIKHILRSLGNLSLHKHSAYKMIDEHMPRLCVDVVEKFNLIIYRDEEKLKVLKLIVDYLSNLCTHNHNTGSLHHDGVTNMVITLLETTEISEDKILMGCIDTIDGICQLEEAENYVVMDRNLPYLLIDLLKVKEDEKLLTKSIRLLTNLTINQVCIPYILQANLMSVLANIVLPVYNNSKIQAYVSKILLRIYSSKPETKLLLSSGYLDCIIKTIEIADKLQDIYVDILLRYGEHIPNYLNNRTFMNLVKLLTLRSGVKQIVEKCLRLFKIIWSVEEKQADDVFIEGSPQMYEKLLHSPYGQVICFIIGLHCTKSRKFKSLVWEAHERKTTEIVNIIQQMAFQEESKEVATSSLFTILNIQSRLIDIGPRVMTQEDLAFKQLVSGFKCKLYRVDGSNKRAIININQNHVLRAYKYPDGEIKKKYVIGIRQIRDWQFNYQNSLNSWNYSVFLRDKNILKDPPIKDNCVTIVGSPVWGQFNILNIEFDNQSEKNLFSRCISALILAFRR